MVRMMIPVFVAALMLSAGCGKQGESVAKKAGKTVGTTITDFTAGVGKGIDKQMIVKVELSEELTKQGVTTTVAKLLGTDSPEQKGAKGITVYFMTKTKLRADLLAKALNSEGMEIGRSASEVELGDDDAKYVTFKFPSEMDTQLVEKYSISQKSE